jgi:nucleotide-binding universal stress UspA family protein
MFFVPGQRHVVVGVDGSVNSLAALRRAAAEAERRHARLDVIRVPDAGTAAHPLRTIGQWLRLRTLAARTLRRSQHFTTRLHIAHGDPGTVLTDAARNADLLVIGARIHSEHGNPFGGDTVPRVLEKAPCEVLICADHTAA